MKPETYRKLSIAVIIAAIVLRIVLASVHTISGDACWHFSAAKFIANEKQFPLFEKIGRDEPFWPSPLFHVVSAFFYTFLGGFGLKLTPFLFSNLSLIIAYLIFKKFLNEKQTFYATLFMSFLPIGIDYSVLGYPESTIVFFIILSVYFAVNSRFLLSGIAAGFAILSKFTGPFVILTLLFLAYKGSKNKKEMIKNFIFVTAVPLIISLPWLIRNWALLGNPVWPFLNFIFNGLQAESYSGLSLANLAQPSTYAIAYLGFFGVPDGHYRAFFFFDIPYIWLLISIFAIATLIFILPLFFGFKKDKKINFVYIFIASFAVVMLLFELNVRPAVSRIMLPAIFALAFIYGVGMQRITEKCALFGKILLALIIIIIGGFSLAEIIKFKAASDSWKIYNDDFEWVKSNTEKGDLFLFGGQCISYRTERPTLFPSSRYFDIESKYDYVWLNQGFKLEPQSVLSEENYNKLTGKIKEQKLKLVYENKKTGTKVYKVVNVVFEKT